ncbi:MAG: hypothetical protein Q8R82_11970 [Hyphomonadaceae bacterium]|nr:hypothetical protein [Hyphomonadaceae bacterium]
MKVLNILMLWTIGCLFGCSDITKPVTKDNEIINPPHSLVGKDTSPVSKTFSSDFFSLLDSSGFEIDSVKLFNEKEIKPFKVSQLFTYYHKVNYDDSVFEFKITNLKWYFISGIDSLMTKEQKKSEFYKGLLGLKEISFSDSSIITAIKNKYHVVLNLNITPGVGQITRTYYDMKNNKIWFLYDRSLKSSKQFNTVSNIVDRVEQNLK